MAMDMDIILPVILLPSDLAFMWLFLAAITVAGFLMLPTYLLVPELTQPLGLSQNLAT